MLQVLYTLITQPVLKRLHCVQQFSYACKELANVEWHTE